MLRKRVLSLPILAVVLMTIAPAGTVAETIGSSNYAAAVDATNPDIYLRLSEPAGMVTGDPVVNDGSLGAGLGGTWGISGYATSAPVSDEVGPRPDVIVNGKALLGLEDDNTAAKFTGVDIGNADLLNLNPAGASAGPTEMDQDDMTYSFWFNTTDNSSWPRLVTSHPSNANRFDLCMNSGMFALITNGGTGMNNTAEAKDSGTPIKFTDGTWHHLVMIRNGDDAANAQLFIDGEEISLAARNGSWSAGYALRVGSKGTTKNPIKGTLDEIAMWGRALSDEEATDLFDAATTVPEPSTMVLLGTLLAGWMFCPRRKA